MNLVIDDAVEVKLATKETSEERRSVGLSNARPMTSSLTRYRPNPAQGRQHLFDPANTVNTITPRLGCGLPFHERDPMGYRVLWILHEWRRACGSLLGCVHATAITIAGYEDIEEKVRRVHGDRLS
jgi:hypothetical protein